jgi:hypothetical protein
MIPDRTEIADVDVAVAGEPALLSGIRIAAA